MNLTDLRALRDKLEPYSYGIGGIQVKLPFGTDDLCLTAYPSTEEKHRKIEEILEPYKDKFLRIDILRSPDPSLEHQFLSRIDFLRLSDLMAHVIGEEVRAICADPPADRIYAFAVGISPAHYSMDLRANSEEEWLKRKAYYAETGSSISDDCKYWSPEFTLEHPHADGSAWDELYELLGDIEGITSEYYDLTHGDGQLFATIERRYTQMAIHALKRHLPLFDSLPKAEHFAAYVQDYTGSGDDAYSALETVPLDTVRVMYSSAFPNSNG